MATISEAKRAANRENAKKSTGPKTAEGKERSRANAFKHGLTGEGVVKADDLKREIQKRVDEWSDALKPKTGLEKWLVERAAVDSARVDVAVECELARHAARSRTDAIYSSNDKLPALLAARIGRQLMSSQDEPGAPWLELRSTSAGCDWMINKWECIARRQEAQEGWSWSDFCHAERLIGESTRADTISRRLATLAADYLAQLEEDWKRDPESTLKEVGITHEELLNSLECSGWYPADLLSPEDVPGDADTRVRANDRLREFVADEIAELTARRDLLPEFEALDAGEASDRLLVDSSPEGVLLNRYEHELHRRVHQSLRELDRLQKARADEPDEAAEPEPAPSRNEATAASRPAPLAASPPPVSNPFRDGGAAANGSMSLHTPFIAPPGHV